MKKQGYFVKFVSLVAFQLRKPRNPGPPPGYAYDLERALKFFHKKKHLKQN